MWRISKLMFILDQMVINRVLSYEEFDKLEESRSTGKKQFGIIGPFADGSMKLKVSKNPNDGLIIYSISEDSIDLQNGERSINLPKRSCDLKDHGNYSILDIKPYTKWITSEDNKEDLHDFIDVFLELKNGGQSDINQSISDDVEMVIELMGIPATVKKCTQISENHFDLDLSNGMEIELKKRNQDDFFKSIKIFKDAKSPLPVCRIKRNSSDKILDFKTPRGEFSERSDSIKDLLSHPISKYLLGVCLNVENENSESILMDHYQKMLKHHEFKIENEQGFNQEKHEAEKDEILRIKRILSNTVNEKVLDSLYNNYRAKK
jgi:hypothetical protein